MSRLDNKKYIGTEGKLTLWLRPLGIWISSIVSLGNLLERQMIESHPRTAEL